MNEPDPSDIFDPLTLRQMLADFGAVALSELMDCFAGNVAQAEEELAQGDAEIDLVALRRVAHNVKGTAAMYGALRLAAEASKLNDLCAAADAASLHQQVQILRHVCRETIDQSTQYRPAV